ncbi:hypothetical protein [Nitrincola sp. MINF-07-Sa-05]|uniref:hypothetical protein n=1 Tax=Nitrincola salilacus TaxID=3400273 RepID=UPI00391801B1
MSGTDIYDEAKTSKSELKNSDTRPKPYIIFQPTKVVQQCQVNLVADHFALSFFCCSSLNQSAATQYKVCLFALAHWAGRRLGFAAWGAKLKHLAQCTKRYRRLPAYLVAKLWI